MPAIEALKLREPSVNEFLAHPDSYVFLCQHGIVQLIIYHLFLAGRLPRFFWVGYAWAVLVACYTRPFFKIC
jgi:hypothetical protein